MKPDQNMLSLSVELPEKDIKELSRFIAYQCGMERGVALEEAARVCEKKAVAPQGEETLACYYACADAIRSLIVPMEAK